MVDTPNGAPGHPGNALLLVFLLLWSRCGLRGCPDVDELRGYMPEEASVLLDREGEEVGKLMQVNRTVRVQ